jgi:hypothetical protein
MHYQNDLPMLYETFLRRVYHCGRGNDPFQLANTDQYHRNENDILEPYTFVGLWTGLYLLESYIVDRMDLSMVKQMRNDFDTTPTGTYFKTISKEIFELLEKYKIYESPQSDSLPYN